MQPEKGSVALVLKGYPRLSETFIAQEILESERAGIPVEIVSLRLPTDRRTHPVHSEISAPVLYLPEYLYQQPLRVLLGLFSSLTRAGFWRAFGIFLKDLVRDFTPNRGRRFGQALVLAREGYKRFAFYYAHFLHTPCSVARYAALINGNTFAISAHAKDIWTTPDWEATEKLEGCDWCVTCTSSGARHLASLSPDGERVALVYHGLDLSRFPSPAKRPGSKRDGSRPGDPVRLLTVGRAVEKKGIDVLLRAMSSLPDSLHWRWSHIGGGPLKQELEDLARSLNLSDKCEFRGALAQEDVLKAYRESDLFILPSRIDATGDRDGLPNVIVEAQSQRLAVVSTNISGIPELIEDGKNGLLVEAEDVPALVAAIAALCRDPGRRAKFGAAGERRVRGDFDHRDSVGEIITRLQKSLESAV